MKVQRHLGVPWVILDIGPFSSMINHYLILRHRSPPASAESVHIETYGGASARFKAIYSGGLRGAADFPLVAMLIPFPAAFYNCSRIWLDASTSTTET
jgi:DUF1365 family protein